MCKINKITIPSRFFCSFRRFANQLATICVVTISRSKSEAPPRCNCSAWLHALAISSRRTMSGYASWWKNCSSTRTCNGRKTNRSLRCGTTSPASETDKRDCGSRQYWARKMFIYKGNIILHHKRLNVFSVSKFFFYPRT